jgi:hypothetical protein
VRVTESSDADPRLLLYSLAEFGEILGTCLEAIRPRTIVEVGSERGTFTRWLLENAPGSCETVYVVEPEPDPEMERLLDGHSRGRLVRGHSPDALAQLPACDVYFIDGDHNYATVTAELQAIAAVGEPIPHVLFHDVRWPWGRRDHYHDPERLPPEARHEYAPDLGPKPGRNELAADGFGAGTLNPATHEGGPRNGVKAAIEDFVEASDVELTYREVPLIFGLGVLYPLDSPHAGALDAILTPFDRHPLLARVEADRVAIYAHLTEVAWLRGEEVRLREAAERARDEARDEAGRLGAEVERLRAELAAVREREAGRPWERLRRRLR